MASISTLRPYRYASDRVADPGAVIAPPYDVVTADARRALLDRDRHNIVRLILPEDGDGRYDHAAHLLREWIEDGVLVREPRRALYAYSESFIDPRSGDQATRRGFIAAVMLEPFSAGIVLPHERTLSAPKADRLKLMRATRADLEPIFGIYADPSGDSLQRLATYDAAEPLIDATDADGARHRIVRIDDADAVDAFIGDLSGESILIVDGHHRYETALAYHAERVAAQDAPEAASTIMMFLAPTSDPGLIILPTHRVVHSLAEFDPDALLESLSEHFVVKFFTNLNEAIAALGATSELPALLLLTRGRVALARLRNSASLHEIVPADMPEPVRSLDVTVLHEYILGRLLGIDAEAQTQQRNIHYVKSDADAVAALDDSSVNLVVMMNATRLDQVEAVARSGSVMPQKSTFFYPKLASGLLINPL